MVSDLAPARRGSYVRGLLDGLVTDEVTRDALLAAGALQACDLAEDEGHVPAARVEAMLTFASRRLGDPALGLHLGESAALARFGMFGHLVQHSRTLGEALAHTSRYHLLLMRGVDVHVRDGPRRGGSVAGQKGGKQACFQGLPGARRGTPAVSSVRRIRASLGKGRPGSWARIQEAIA